MTKEERLSGNRLIGEFMSRSFAMSHISDYNGSPDDALPPMKYHTSWSELMRAWYKFVDLKFKDPMNQLKHSELKAIAGIFVRYMAKVKKIPRKK